MDRARIHEIYGSPFKATLEEISILAQEAYEYRKLMVGLTVRDQFAIAALPALISVGGGAGQSMTWQEYAGIAYVCADAMMEARKI